MRVLALSNTRFAMDTKKLYLQRILRWNDLSWVNSTFNCVRGDAWLIFALCDVYAFHNCLNVLESIYFDYLYCGNVWFSKMIKLNSLNDGWVTFCSKIRKVSSSSLVCGGWTFWWDNVKSTKQSILATTTGHPALYLDPDCLWTSPPCPPRPPLGVTRIQILPQICMSDVWELEWQWRR